MTFLPLYLLLLFVGGMFSTVAGGGLGIVLIIAGSFFFDVRTSIVLVSFLTVGIQVAKIFNFYTFTRWDIVGWYVCTGIPASLIGGFLLFIVPEIVPRIGLSVICVFFVIMRFWKLIPTMKASAPGLLGLGAVNGLVGGMIGNSSLIRMPALVTMGVSKEAFVATSSMISFLMGLGKLSAYSFSFVWTREQLILLALSVPTLFLSVYIGKKFLKYLSIQFFEDLQLAIILMGAVRLLFFP